MKKLIFAILIFFSFQTYSQYLSPKYSAICYNYSFVNITINSSTTSANLMKWYNLENGTTQFLLTTDTTYRISKRGTYVCDFLYTFLNTSTNLYDTTLIASDTVYVFDFTPQIIIPAQINTLDTITFEVNLNQYPPAEIPFEEVQYLWFIDNSLIQEDVTSFFSYSFETSKNYSLEVECIMTGCQFEQTENIFVAPKILPLLPSDTLLCDTGTSFNLYTNLYNSSYNYIWENISMAHSDTTNSPIYSTKMPGQYILKIQDQDYNTVAQSDYANINWFWEPLLYIISPMGQTPNNPIDFKIETAPFLYDDYISSFEWNFGDGTVIDYDTSHNQTHSYQNVGTYNIQIRQQTNSCIYNTSTTIDIFDHYFYIEPQVGNIYNYDDSVKLKINTSYSLEDFSDIKWFVSYKNSFSDLNVNKKLLASNIDSIITNIPGKIFVDAQLNTPLLKDTAYIDFSYGYEPHIIMKINDIDSIITNIPGKIFVDAQLNTPLLKDTAYIDFSYGYKPHIIMKINDNEYNQIEQNYAKLGNIVFTAELQPPFSQYNINDYFFQWQIDESIEVSKGYGLNTIEHNFAKTGIYFVRLLVTDPQKCTYIYTYRIVIIPEEQPIKISKEVNNYGNILVKISDIENFRLYSYEKNSFVKKLNRNIMVGNEISDTIFVRQAKNLNLEDVNHLTLYLKFAGAGNLNIKLTNPEYIQSNFDISLPNSQISLWGMPSYNILNLSQSYTNPYYFNSFYEPIQTEQIPFYYSPDKQLILPQTQSTVVINGGFYQIGGLEPLLNKKINGTWTISLELDPLNSAHGYIEEYGFIFDKKLYEIELLPIQMTCTDQFGRTFELEQGFLSIKNLDAAIYTLNCNARYANIDTIINKTLEVSINNYSSTKYFTPNGDGINDTWLPVSPDSKCEIFIINKLGQIVIVLKSEELPQGWDGTYYGKPIPSDSYWYIVTTQEGYTSTGILNIVR